ncbi:hypothetical protein ACRARG_16445 [Pseudooceanicola sp. C21-150M6]|uniref:hypothetical protein n=1 Tax=Pseudooceanicola sp. C21-150M6 TaxID=3434355 RepID=UPI003D7F3B76
MTDAPIQDIARARAEGREARIDGALPASPEMAYSLAMQSVGTPAAWKVGGANPWSRKVFGNTEVFFGALAPAEVRFLTAEVPLDGLVAPLAEPELALRIADPEASDAKTAFDAAALSVEIPASVLPPEAKSILMGQILDRAGAGALWIGPVLDQAPHEIPDDFTCDFIKNQETAIAGAAANILPSPLGAAMEMLALCRRYGIRVTPGQWIASGGLCPAVPVQPGDRIALSMLGSTVSFDFV